MLIAVPSEAPGGLDAAISEHFGHCHAFTLVNVDDGQIGEITIMENAAHEEGGCMTPVMNLKQNHVEALIAGGMGMRPLAGFEHVGITVYKNEDAANVRDAIQRVIDGKAEPFEKSATCGGGGGECGGGHHHHKEVVREPLEGPKDVRDDRVISFHYVLTDQDGEQLDASPEGQPLSYLHGHGNIVPGLEKAMNGLNIGDEKVVEVPAAEAYGDRDEDRIIEIPREHLPPQISVGAMLRAAQPDGRMAIFKVMAITDDMVRIDPNHPLAGKDLTFKITIANVEKATEEEIQHGHTH